MNDNCALCGNSHIEIAGWWQGELWVKCEYCNKAYVPNLIMSFTEFNEMTEAIMAEADRVRKMNAAVDAGTIEPI